LCSSRNLISILGLLRIARLSLDRTALKNAGARGEKEIGRIIVLHVWFFRK
jgi:hypothetical protein